METSLFITNMEFVASRNLVKLIIPMERRSNYTLEFTDGLMLHVPLQESHLLSRYVGLQKTNKTCKLGGNCGLKQNKLQRKLPWT